MSYLHLTILFSQLLEVQNRIVRRDLVSIANERQTRNEVWQAVSPLKTLLLDKFPYEPRYEEDDTNANNRSD